VLTYVIGFVLALAVAAIMTPLMVRVGYAIGAVDHPGEARKIHDRAIPRIGGIAVALGFFAPLIGLAIYTNDISRLIYADGHMIVGLILGACAILLLGVYDDVRGAGALLKLSVQSAVAVGLWFSGFRIELLGLPLGGVVQTSSVSLPLTVLWVVGVINALNLIDGLDGLAAGVALLSALVLLGVAFIEGAVLLCLLTCTLAGALAGFLFYNFNPARIFLGDSGSMFLGLILAATSLWTQRKGATAAALLVPVLALGLPILDTTLSIVRRIGKGQSPFRADRDHLHHRLLALGLSHRNAVLTLYTVSGVFALAALAMLDNDGTRRAIALATLATAVMILLWRVKVVQFATRGSQSALAPDSLRDFARHVARQIRGAGNLDSVWEALTEIGPRLALGEMRLCWRVSEGREVVYRWRSRGTDRGDAWALDAGPGPYHRTKRLTVREEGRRFGELAVLFDSARSEPKAMLEELPLEMVCDALVDFAVRAHAEPARDEDREALDDRVVRIALDRR
jgi:UDP-GlcNAc:undecaprenyl-phosphate/decaprenyl-phosphate GlcNAc-1-phosphate transferase